MYSVIIVDDEELITASLHKYITKLHPELHCIGTFTDGESVLDFLQTSSVDIIITDILMPGMDGLEMIRRIRKLMPEVAIIIISSYSEFDYAKRAITYGVRNYLLKPIDFRELSGAINDITRQLQANTPQVNCDEDNIQLFFIDLLCHMINSKEALEKRFRELPFAYENYKGCILSVTLDNNTFLQWKYGMETLSTALLNNVRMNLFQYEIYYLYKHHSCFFFILLSHEEVPAFSTENLADRINETMGWNCSCQFACTFHAIEDLLSTQVSDLPQGSHPLLVNPEEDNATIQNALNYIQVHFADDLSREDVARAVYLTPSYFSRIFKQKTNMSFISYLTQVRMEKAVELLKTQMNVSDIAEAVGYMHRNRFITNFRKFSGYSPTEYRKEILMKDN